MEELLYDLRFLFLLALLGVNSFFAAAEVALVSVRQTRLRQLAENGSRSARIALELIEAPDRLFSATQLGVTLASLGLGWAGESTVYGPIKTLMDRLPIEPVESIAHVIAFSLSFLCITFLHMVLGEVVPKNLALERSERLALAVAPPLHLFARFSGFFVSLVKGSATGISRLFGIHSSGEKDSYSTEELKHVFDRIQSDSKADQPQREMLERVIDFHTLTVREVMVPRKDIISLPIGAKLDQVIDTLARNRHTRLLIYENSPENLVGVLDSKEFWAYIQQARRWQLLDRPEPPFRMKSFLHDLEFVPETKDLYELLEQFQQQRFQMAAVVDEFGTVVGILTAEDAIEQIVGEILEKHETPNPRSIEKVLILDGITNIVDLATRYDIELPYDAGFETLAGFLLSRIGHIPTNEEYVEYDDLRFTVTRMEGNRIGTVFVEKLVQETGVEPTEN